ncbi:MAG: DUF4157 domain-containing protein [Myxococcales bacterium]|nr:DUF4157 domain-containing protein [Myxococcales bacterium]
MKGTRTHRDGAAVDSPELEVAAPALTAAHRAAMAAWSAEQGAGEIGPVQAHADGHREAMSTWSAEQAGAVATASVAGASSALPHGDVIQDAFGPHDVSNVRAEVGGGAGEAARSIGATAFATGDRVGFASSPDLHTAAHEAAHVVQQRQGVVSYKGLGPSDDPHERHADRVADAVVAGRSAAPLLGEITAGGRLAPAVVQRKPLDPAAVPATGDVAATSLGLFKAAPAPGDELVRVTLEAGRLPADVATGLGIAPEVSVTVALAIVGTDLALAITAGGSTLVAKVDLDKLLTILAGPAGAQVAELLPKAQEFLASAAGRFTGAGAGHVKIHLWGDPQTGSFVVIDVVRAVRGAWQGSTSGLRPIEARLATKAGRVEQFADDQVKAATALPDAGTALGSLELAAPELRHGVLGLADDLPVHATVYYGDGKLAVAIKPDAAATTGVVAEIDLAYLVGKLKALGEKAWHLLDGLLDRLKRGGRDFLNWASGLLRFDLGGNFGSFFAFDFRMLLPRLGGGGGGFHLGALWPTSWSFDLPGLKLGALPRLSVPWLKWPKLGSFGVDLGRLKDLFGNLGLPSLPSLPSIDFDLHFAGLELGLALDLGRLWPDLDWGEGGPSTFGVNLDLSALLELLAKAGGAIASAARWLVRKLRAAGGAVKRWIHLGQDGLIRIFDGQARDPDKTPMLGFSLVRLLDGAQATDLAPVEIRYHGDDADLELGAAVAAGPEAAAEAAKDRPDGAAAPQRPAAPLAEQDGVALPETAITTLGLAPGATGYVAIAGEYPHLIAYAEAKSGHRDGQEALRLSLDVARLAAQIKAKLPPASGRGARAPVPHLGGVKIGDDAALEIRLGEKAADGDKPVPYARAAWRVSKLIGAKDLSALIPDELALEAPGTAGLVRGAFDRPAGLIGDRFAIPAPSVRRDVLAIADGKDDVFLGVYFADQMLALTATGEADKDEGLLGYVNVVKLLEQLKRLGALGERMLDVLGQALGAAVDGARGFAAKAAAVAAKIGRGVMAIVDRVLRIQLPTLKGGGGGGWIGWDLSRLAPNISLSGFSLDGLIPDFEGIALPGLPGLSLSWLPALHNPFAGTSLGKIAWPAVDLKRLLSGIGVDLPALPKFDFEVFGLDGLGLGISLDLAFLDGALGDLFGGQHKLSFQLDLAALLGPFEKAWAWLKRKFGGRIKKDDPTLPHVALGGDGVLRLWDDEAHIGFQLTRLLDGFQPSDVVPVELQFHVTTGGKAGAPTTELASFEYGRVVDGDHKAPATPEAGQVLATRPEGKAQASARFDAPPLVRDHLGAPAGADVVVELLADGDDAVLFAKVTGTDRGMVIRIDRARLAGLAAKIGGQSTTDIDGGVRILWPESKAAHGIVLGFGPKPKPGTKQQDVQPHGHAMWRLHRFFDGLDVGDLVPDEARYDRAEGGFAVGVGLDVSRLPKVADIDVPDSPSWVQAAVGPRAEVHANASEQHLRVALVSAADEPGAPRRGVELDVAEWFLDEAERVVAAKVKQATTAVGNVLRKTQRAGAAIGGDLTERRIGVEARASGLRLQRGKDGDADHLYATFGWSNLVDVVSKGELAGLVPTEFRIATKSMALEVEDLALASDATMPADAKRIGGMHQLFRDTLTTFGLGLDDFLALDLGKSPIQELGDGTHSVNLVGQVFTPKDKPPAGDHAEGIAIADAKQVTLSMGLEALLAQVLPRQRKFASPKKPKPKQGTHMSLGLKRDVAPEQAGDQLGVELGVTSVHEGKKGTRTIEIHAGWTAEKLVTILMNLDDIVGPDATPDSAMGLLTPDVVGGSFANHLFKVAIENRGERVGEEVRVGDLPLLPDILASFVDQHTANETRLWLEVPGASELASQFGKALLAGEYVKLGRAAIDMPGAAYPFAISLSLSLSFLERLAGFIPYVGLAIKIIRGVQGLVTNPKETVENLLYEPELFMHAFENAGEIYDKLKTMSWKDAALIFMSNDASTKQLVYAARLKKRLKAAGVTLPDGQKGGEMPSAEELAWLNKQDPKAIEKAVAVEAKLAELGLLSDDDAAGAPTGTLNVDELTTLEATIEAGFTEYATAKAKADAAPDDAAAQTAKAAAAEKFRKAVAARIAAGAKKQASDREPSQTDPAKLPDGAPAPEGDEALVDLKDLPEPDADQLALAEAMWKDSKEGYDPTHQSYLIQKFGFLSIEQLATLLERGVVTVPTRAGASKALPMFESERPFVQQLFVEMAKQQGWRPKTKDDGTPGATSAELVQAWRQRNQQAADQAKKDARTQARADAAATAAAGGGARTGGGSGGSGGSASAEGDVDESLDDAFWADEREHDDASSGGGATGDGLDTDGDGELSADELKADPAKEPAADGDHDGEHEADGEAAAGGGEATEPVVVDDTRLWQVQRPDALRYVTWDERTATLGPNAAAIAETIAAKLTRTTSTGEVATLDGIDVTIGGEVSGDAGKRIIEFTVVWTATTPSGVLRSIAFAYFYDVSAKDVFASGGGPQVLAAMRRSFALRDDRVVLRDKALVIGPRALEVLEVISTRKLSDGYLVKMHLKAVKVPEGTRIRNAEDRWQTIADGDSFDAELPYVPEAAD